MSHEKISLDDIGFAVKRPCNDCPFRKNTPLHRGVGADLATVLNGLEHGRVAHSCHKTDPRSDSPQGQAYKGKVQHCAGYLIMAANHGAWTAGMEAGLMRGEYDPATMCDPGDVYTPLDMIRAYTPLIQSVIAEAAEQDYRLSDDAFRLQELLGPCAQKTEG